MADRSLHNQPIQETSDYEQGKVRDKINQAQVMNVLKEVFPNLWLIGQELLENHTNAWLLVLISRELARIHTSNGGQGWGKVTVEISKDSALFIRGENAIKTEEPLIQKYDEDINQYEKP
jgi:hypothetical protein